MPSPSGVKGQCQPLPRTQWSVPQGRGQWMAVSVCTLGRGVGRVDGLGRWRWGIGAHPSSERHLSLSQCGWCTEWDRADPGGGVPTGGGQGALQTTFCFPVLSFLIHDYFVPSFVALFPVSFG